MLASAESNSASAAQPRLCCGELVPIARNQTCSTLFKTQPKLRDPDILHKEDPEHSRTGASTSSDSPPSSLPVCIVILLWRRAKATMDASTDSRVSAPTVLFKRKRGPASRATAASTSTQAAEASSSDSTAGASRVSRHVPIHHPQGDSDGEGSDSGSAVVITKKKRSKLNPLVQSTGSVLRRPKLDRADSGDSDEDQDSGIRSTASGAYRDRFGDSSASSSHPPSSNSRGDSLQRIRDDATRHSDWDLETLSPSLKEAPKASNADGLYRGANSYSSYIAPRDDGTSSKMRSRGPIRQTTTVRTTSLMDYQPDICKDYKETGYCGFGDTCKFLHDRSDYLAGWQLDVLPNSSSRTRENLLSDPEGSDAEEEDEVPFACLICRQPFTDPVVTRCGHYFCSACAIKRFAKNSKCFACGAQTGGLFNSATKVLDKMEKAKQRKAQQKAEKNSWKTVDDVQPISQLGGADSDTD